MQFWYFQVIQNIWGAGEKTEVKNHFSCGIFEVVIFFEGLIKKWAE